MIIIKKLIACTLILTMLSSVAGTMCFAHPDGDDAETFANEEFRSAIDQLKVSIQGVYGSRGAAEEEIACAKSELSRIYTLTWLYKSDLTEGLKNEIICEANAFLEACSKYQQILQKINELYSKIEPSKDNVEDFNEKLKPVHMANNRWSYVNICLEYQKQLEEVENCYSKFINAVYRIETDMDDFLH